VGRTRQIALNAEAPPAADGAGELAALLGEIAACRACAGELPHTPRPVVQVARGTRILICGQAPGRRVHESGLPFDDPSGERLRDWLGVDRATFYGRPEIGVAAMAFCFPGTDPKGGDYPPPRRCAELWRARLLASLPQVELTLLVGGHAQAWALGDRRPMTDLVRDWRSLAPAAIPLPHPSWRNSGWLKRNPWFEAEVVPYLRRRVGEILVGDRTSS
jgi:uracil-DNA glycosylase